MALSMIYDPSPLPLPSPVRPTLEHLPPTPSHSPLSSTKRLRSCLSPVRRYANNPLDSAIITASTTRVPIPMSQTSTISTDEPCLTRASSPMTSRTSSFSSNCEEDRYWRRTKSVRWVEGQEEGCVMAAVYSTYSADDYDRSPLEPPKPEERACFLPARGSRCLSPSGMPERSFDSRSIPFFSLAPDSDSASVRAQEAEADGEWAECMDRRQLYAAQMSIHMQARLPGPWGQSDNGADEALAAARERATGFEGYTSLSATLATLLHATGSSREPREVSTPMGSPQEGDSPLKAAMRYREEEVRGRTMERSMGPVLEEDEEETESAEEDVDEEEGGDDEDEDEDVGQPSLETVMAALRAFRSGPGPLLGTGDEQRDRE